MVCVTIAQKVKENKMPQQPRDAKYDRIEYMCTYCGKRTVRVRWAGRPEPGTCPRRNGNSPHRWIINVVR